MPLLENKPEVHFPGNNVENKDEVVILSIGSNMGERELNIKKAVELLRSSGVNEIKTSSFYETAPVGYTNQEYFLNAAVVGRTRMSPHGLLGVIHDIEGCMGRRRDIHWGPRIIDIDIIFFGRHAVSEPDLVIPHPEYRKRAFVILPVLEILPNFKGLDGVPLRDYMKDPEVAAQDIEKLRDRL